MSDLAENLVPRRDRLQQQVDAARGFGQEIRPDVLKWLESASEIIGQAEKLKIEMNSNKRCVNGWCIDLGSTSKLSKEAKRISERLKSVPPPPPTTELPSVGLPPPPPSIKFMSNPDFMVFESTKSTLHQIIEALKDENCNIVGVVGMGGVGKTTLAKEIAKKAKEEKQFDQVVMAVVSQNKEVKQIQGQIASMLQLPLDQQADESGRASQLRERIMKVERILVILDDVWEKLDLTAVGIPLGNEHKGCKIMLTTRKEDVCYGMKVRKDKMIHVKVLSEEESWGLFKQNARDAIESVDLKEVAEVVMRECQGLPIALVTVGSALRDKDFEEWSAAKLQLKNSTPTLIEGVDKAIVSCLKLSSDYLEGKETKLCFLLCCLFPEDYNINIEDIVKYAVGKGLWSQYAYPIAEVRILVRSTIKKLKASCLLLGSEHWGNCVKMHDVVRDVAISIASEGENHFLVRTGVGLMEWPTMSSIEQYTGISLMANNIRVLPEGLESPKLEILSLRENNALDKIPDSFFKGMKMLKVLDLRKNRYQFERCKLEILSLQYLTSLQTLLLENCELDNTQLLGHLRSLRH